LTGTTNGSDEAEAEAESESKAEEDPGAEVVGEGVVGVGVEEDSTGGVQVEVG
jgi:hypothetical protein